jgi:hypothetical protein
MAGQQQQQAAENAPESSKPGLSRIHLHWPLDAASFSLLFMFPTGKIPDLPHRTVRKLSQSRPFRTLFCETEILSLSLPLPGGGHL